MLRRLIGDDIELVTHLEPALGITRADAGNIHQVLLNLAVNARDAMPHGGKLTISSSNVIINGGKTNHVNAAPGRYIELAISDTGMGMTPDVMEHLFEPFFTTKAPGRGTGLGLSTVYGIVQQTGGHISVDSQPNCGSVFSVLFPRVDQATDGSAAVSAPQLKGGTEAILLVEDQAEVRVLTASLLRELGYSVQEAEGPVRALEFAQSGDVSFDLILTDIVMPTMGGIELAERIKLAQPTIKVLFMSGYTDRSVFDDKPEARQLPYIQKPFTRESLDLKIREALDHI
jgi:CheY-like chemotaxis protein